MGLTISVSPVIGTSLTDTADNDQYLPQWQKFSYKTLSKMFPFAIVATLIPDTLSGKSLHDPNES
jgi:hypothetical protein